MLGSNCCAKSAANAGPRPITTTRRCVETLYEKRVNFYRGCFPQDLHRKDQSTKIFFSYQDPLDSHQGTTLNSYPLAALQERMRLHAGSSFDNPPNGFDLGVFYGGRLTGGGHNGMHPRRSHNGQSTLETTSKKDVAGEKW